MATLPDRRCAMARRKTYKLLTEVELEFMTVLWRLEEAAVREILDNLEPHRDLAYTSAATIMRILEDKGFVRSKKSGRTFLYRPTLSKESYQSRSLKNLSEKLFDNAPAALVAHLVEDSDLSDEALAEIQSLLDRKRGK